MPFLFKSPSNYNLLIRLKEKISTNRQQRWVDYVNYHATILSSDAALEKACEKYIQYDRIFYLIQGSLTDENLSHLLNRNYAYLLDEESQAVYLAIPSSPLRFKALEQAHSDQIATIIRKKPGMWEATRDEMDEILTILGPQGNELTPAPMPQFLNHTKITISHGNGRFLPWLHAPNTYAFRNYLLEQEALQLQLETQYRNLSEVTSTNQEEKLTPSLLTTPWYARAKENFSWVPLVDTFAPNPSKSEIIMSSLKRLETDNELYTFVLQLEKELKYENLDYSKVTPILTHIKDILDKEERDNLFIRLVLGGCGAIAAPFALLLGLIAVTPAYCLGWQYFGTAAFLWDACVWFMESLVEFTRALLFPIAMIHAYCTTGSMNVFEGECTRIVERLLETCSSENEAPALLPFKHYYLEDKTPGHTPNQPGN